MPTLLSSPLSSSKMTEKRFLHPYYILNTLLCLCYVALRVQRLKPGELGATDMFGITREQQIYFCLFLMLVTRSLSAPTLDAYFASAFMFARATAVVCLWFMNSRMAVVFVALWSLIYAVCPQPRYRLPKNITVLNNVTYNQRIAKNNHKTIYVLWCHATWSARCNQLLPVLPRLSKKYSHVRVRFASLDVSRYVGVAETLGVNTSPASKQLPTVILFKEGKEVARIPPADDNGNVPREWTRGFTDRHIADRLDLITHLQTAKQWEQDAQSRHREKKKN